MSTTNTTDALPLATATADETARLAAMRPHWGGWRSYLLRPADSRTTPPTFYAHDDDAARVYADVNFDFDVVALVTI